MDAIGNILWHEAFWLPRGSTWDDMKNKPDSPIYIPQRGDMAWSLLGGLVLVVIRYLLEYFITSPLGFKIGVKQKKRRPVTPNSVLEEEYKMNGLNYNNNLEAVAKRTDMSVREVERWLRARKEMSKPPDIQRFNESIWQFIFYTFSFTYGLAVLWDKPWLWDTKHCWDEWPNDATQDIYWYYMIELSFYWSLVFTILTDHKRKDFVQMFIHHIVTIILIFFSWAIGYPRIGTLIMCCHDIADIPMSYAKMMGYCGRPNQTDAAMVLFVIAWVLSRLVYFPFIVLRSVMHEAFRLPQPFLSYDILAGLLFVLQGLHLLWSYMIARIVVNKFRKGKVTDVRSDTENEG